MNKIRKVRLVEENIKYDDLAVEENFSENEISYDLNRAMLDERKERKALKKAKFLKQQIKDLKQFSLMGMRSIVDTIQSIDENSKKIVFKHFDHNNVNFL